MRGVRSTLAFVVTIAAVGASSAWGQGPFLGADLGASEPLDGNYRGHVRTGISLNPFAGYMFNEYLGAQGELHVVWQTEDNHFPEFPNQSRQATTLIGGTAGPRLALPFETLLGKSEFYATGQGGYFEGTSGRLRGGGPGFSVGGGLDWYVIGQLSVGLFGRFNYAFMTPTPADLGPGQVPEERVEQNIRWAVGGLSVKYQFVQEEAPAPVPEPPQVPVVKHEQPLPPPSHKKIVLRSVYFEFDRSAIRTDAAPVLDEAAGLLHDEGMIDVTSEGHTDSIGTDAYNLKLGQRRADSVRNYLINKGIKSNRIRTETYGESRPVATNDTAEGRAQNRRVELRVEEPQH